MAKEPIDVTEIPGVKEAIEDVQDFMRNVFTPEGEYQDKEYPKSTNKCKFCPYADRPDLCNRKNS